MNLMPNHQNAPSQHPSVASQFVHLLVMGLATSAAIFLTSCASLVDGVDGESQWQEEGINGRIRDEHLVSTMPSRAALAAAYAKDPVGEGDIGKIRNVFRKRFLEERNQLDRMAVIDEQFKQALALATAGSVQAKPPFISPVSAATARTREEYQRIKANLKAADALSAQELKQLSLTGQAKDVMVAEKARWPFEESSKAAYMDYITKIVSAKEKLFQILQSRVNPSIVKAAALEHAAELTRLESDYRKSEKAEDGKYAARIAEISRERKPYFKLQGGRW